ncbi:hypothetical protein QFZ77_003655 [Paenibacillus sp. V4I3]|nr:hypothetical protein [Paenibacillus sp. V4I3]
MDDSNKPKQTNCNDSSVLKGNDLLSLINSLKKTDTPKSKLRRQRAQERLKKATNKNK